MLNEHQIEKLYQLVVFNKNKPFPSEILESSSQIISQLILIINTHLEYKNDDIHKYVIILKCIQFSKLLQAKSNSSHQLEQLNISLFIKHMNSGQYSQMEYMLLNNISKVTNQFILQIYKIMLDSFEKIVQPKMVQQTIQLIIKMSKKIPQHFINILNNNKNKRYFGECLLQLLNRLINPQQIIQLLTFINSIYGKVDQFFYFNDLKIAIDIIIRFLEDPFSIQLTQKCLETFLFFTCSEFYHQIKCYRSNELRAIISNLVIQSQVGSQMKDEILSIYLE